MKRIFRGALALSMLTALNAFADSCCVSTDGCETNQISGMTFFRPRPADQNTALNMMGVADKMHLWDKECEFYGVFSVAVGYEQSANKCGMGQYFSFGADGKTTFGADSNTALTTGGETIAIDATSNARAIDFGLSPSFKSELKFSPKIKKGIINLDLFLGLDEFINGLWFRATAPIIWASYKLNACEENAAKGGEYYAAGFVDNSSTLVDKVPYSSAEKAWGTLGAFGDVEASACGRISCKSDTTTRLGAIHLDLGYDIIRCECGHFGLALHGVIGTGNSPKACQLFPAVAGSYNNQLGGVLDASWRIWSCDEEQYVTLYGNVVISHLFSDTQVRLLGLNVGTSTAGNSYLLMKAFDDAGAYTNKIVRGSSCLARSIKVRNNYLLDGSLMLQWRRCWLDLSIGYNFFYISEDKSDACKGEAAASCKGACVCNLDAANYGIKGISTVGDGSGTLNDDFYSKADSNIHASGTAADAVTAVASDTAAFVKESDVTKCVALAPSAWSNKIFGYIGYNWECCDYQPYIGLGGSYEWAEKNKMADQWGIYLKGGIQF